MAFSFHHNERQAWRPSESLNQGSKGPVPRC